MVTQEHWDNLYRLLIQAHEQCCVNQDETYRIKIGIILDHMVYNKPYTKLNTTK